MDVRVRRSDGTWEKIDLSSDIVSRRNANNSWHSFNPKNRKVISKKVDRVWEDQVPKTRYSR